MAAWLAGGFAALVAVLTTVAIERWGGRIGGLLGSMPTTIVPASLGIFSAASDEGAFARAMCAVPLGMLLSALFLWAWRVVPPRIRDGSLASRLLKITAVTLLVWLAAAFVVTAVIKRLGDDTAGVAAVGALGLVAILVAGTWACWAPLPTPPGRRPVSWSVLVARGLLAGCAITISVLIARSGNAVAAGVASVFPAIFLTTMVALWWSQGATVQVGAVGPMMLGSSSVASYALVAAWSMPTFGSAAGAVLAWLGAVASTTFPAWAWLARRPARL